MQQSPYHHESLPSTRMHLEREGSMHGYRPSSMSLANSGSSSTSRSRYGHITTNRRQFEAPKSVLTTASATEESKSKTKSVVIVEKPSLEATSESALSSNSSAPFSSSSCQRKGAGSAVTEDRTARSSLDRKIASDIEKGKATRTTFTGGGVSGTR